MPSPPPDDFNADDYLKVNDRSLEDLRSDVSSLKDRYGADKQFVATFTEIYADSKKLSGVINESLCELIRTDPKTAEALKEFIKQADRKAYGALGKTVISGVGAVALLAVGALFSHIRW